MILTCRRSNSGLMRAMYPSSVVQTGVKSFGCENRTPHELPSQSWNLMGPCVVVASKSGARAPIGSGPLIGDVLFRPCAKARASLAASCRRAGAAQSEDGLADTPVRLKADLTISVYGEAPNYTTRPCRPT